MQFLEVEGRIRSDPIAKQARIMVAHIVALYELKYFLKNRISLMLLTVEVCCSS